MGEMVRVVVGVSYLYHPQAGIFMKETLVVVLCVVL